MKTIILNVDRFLAKGNQVALKTKYGNFVVTLETWEFILKHEQHLEPEPLVDELEALLGGKPAVQTPRSQLGNARARLDAREATNKIVGQQLPDFNTPSKEVVLGWVDIFNDPDAGDTIKSAIVDRLMDISEECLIWTTKGLPAPVRAAIAQGRSIRLDDPSMGGSMMSDSLQLYAAGKYPDEVRGNPLVPPPAEINPIKPPQNVVDYLNKVNTNRDDSKAKALKELGIGTKT